MLIFISGGVRSGKSALGERLVLRRAKGRKIYLATSEVYDEEMERRVARHRSDRAGKGFVTVEKSRAVGELAPELQPTDAMLLDCLGTLLANEMFAGGAPSRESADALVGRVFLDLMELNRSVELLVVISNEVFSDGVQYGTDTLAYIQALGRLHRLLAQAAAEAYECCYGIVVRHKGLGEE